MLQWLIHSIKVFWNDFLKHVAFVCHEKIKVCDFFTLNDNDLHTRPFLANKRVSTIHHQPYSSDSSHSDYYAVLKLKLEMNGDRFERIEDIQKAVSVKLITFSYSVSGHERFTNTVSSLHWTHFNEVKKITTTTILVNFI